MDGKFSELSLLHTFCHG